MQDVTDVREWIGKEQIRKAVIDQRTCELLAVTLGEEVPEEGDALRLPWHWSWFNDARPVSELGRDGHPKKGGFLPPVSLPRRMWAGGELKAHKPVLIGHEITRRSVIENIQEKSGRSGALCIVTVRHELIDAGTLCVEEKQSLVYREDPKGEKSEPAFVTPPTSPDSQIGFTPDPVLMFRYSALTFNGHRIHYDVDYAREVEGYRGLVFHAPLTATKLYQLAREISGAEPTGFTYRATTPLFCNEAITLCGKQDGENVTLWAENPLGSQAMIAEATF